MSNHDTIVVMPSSNSEQFQELCDSLDVDYRIVPLTRITKEWRVALAYIFCFPIEIFRLAQLLRRENIELVHASGGSWQYKAILASWLMRIPSVWHLNDTSMPLWIRYVFRLFTGLPDAFIFASERSRQYYGKRLASKLSAVIPSAVNSRFFDPSMSFDGDKETLAALGDNPVIGTIANINPIKGLETLVRCVAELMPRHPEIKVVVIGSAHRNQLALKERLYQLADDLGVAETIEWVGSRQDVRPILARINIYICSSLAESSPVSVWEAMSMGKAIVSTDVGDVSRYIRHGENGYIVKIGDYKSMAYKVSQLLDRPELGAVFGCRARAVVEDNFSPQIIAEKTENLYELALLNANGNRKGRKL
ncbi:glycosyltransferase family 4 protein [Parahaliea maris]